MNVVLRLELSERLTMVAGVALVTRVMQRLVGLEEMTDEFQEGKEPPLVGRLLEGKGHPKVAVRREEQQGVPIARAVPSSGCLT